MNTRHDHAASKEGTTASKKSQKPLLVKAASLPLACPGPSTPLWNQHPKVYLPIEETGQAVCPYCSATYLLEK